MQICRYADVAVIRVVARLYRCTLPSLIRLASPSLHSQTDHTSSWRHHHGCIHETYARHARIQPRGANPVAAHNRRAIFNIIYGLQKVLTRCTTRLSAHSICVCSTIMIRIAQTWQTGPDPDRAWGRRHSDQSWCTTRGLNVPYFKDS